MDPKRLTQILTVAPQITAADLSQILQAAGHDLSGVVAKGPHSAAGLLARHAARAGMAGQARCHRGRII